MKSVAIVTATTGRKELVRAIESVQWQSYPCQHYIFFDGVPVNVAVPHGVHVIPLPIKTGANGIMNGGVCAAAAYLTQEDYLCFLDDDNWLEPNHVEDLVNVIGDNPYAYSLRNLVNPDGTFWGRDDGESLGHFGELVDVNCYMMARGFACDISPLWYKSNGTLMVGDRYVWKVLSDNKVPYAASGKYSVNYRMSARGQDMRGYFFLKNIQKRGQYPDGFPWAA